MSDVEYDPERAVAEFTCPRCGATPGDPCVWRQRPTWSDVHAPRMSRQYRADRRRAAKEDVA